MPAIVILLIVSVMPAAEPLVRLPGWFDLRAACAAVVGLHLTGAAP